MLFYFSKCVELYEQQHPFQFMRTAAESGIALEKRGKARCTLQYCGVFPTRRVVEAKVAFKRFRLPTDPSTLGRGFGFIASTSHTHARPREGGGGPAGGGHSGGAGGAAGRRG
ncbi:unnamed protein product [Polarella glacialis]|uniref:Uncharacterized protein n=1 Tax=Polarella glacialis TaxID=89957 RepID=A0A813L4M4_POLGL|nr:unnamed protein product [Polarella glacialis]